MNEPDGLICNYRVRTDRQISSLAHCRAAIDIIPSNTTSFDPASPGERNQAHPLDVHLTHPSRNRQFFLPAAFRSGTCVVIVEPNYRQPPVAVPPPLQAASIMYFQIWPAVKRAATLITERCQLRNRWGDVGRFNARILLDGHWFYYSVMVRPAPRNMPGEGWKVRFQHPL